MHVRWTECKFYIQDLKQGLTGFCRPVHKTPNSAVVLWFDEYNGIRKMTRAEYDDAVKAKRIRVGSTVPLKTHLVMEDQFKILGYALEVTSWQVSSTQNPQATASEARANKTQQQLRPHA